MRIILKNQASSLSVNTNGAYVDAYEVDSIPILFPKVMVKIGESLKIRGGMHVCAPNFGVDASGDLVKHGFLRDREWDVCDKSDTFVKLKAMGEKSYEGVEFYIIYELVNDSFYISLIINNKADRDVKVAPGFHPYFYSDHSPVVINGIDIDNKDLENSIFNQSKEQELLVNNKNILVNGMENVNQFVYWTDFKGDYICVEPTYMGDAFNNKEDGIYNLKSGEEFIQKIEIKVLS